MDSNKEKEFLNKILFLLNKNLNITLSLVLHDLHKKTSDARI